MLKNEPVAVTADVLYLEYLKCRVLMQEFCDRVDRGEVRSVTTYRKFSEALAAPVQLVPAQNDPWQPSGVDYDRAIHGNPNAKAWADLFVETFPGLADKHDLMIGWFANAMMAMHDHLVANTSQPQLTVWEGAMPESNGKRNFTAVLMRKEESLLNGISNGITIARSEYPGRVRYEADLVRWLIGELKGEKPCVIDYDTDEHSGYVYPPHYPVKVHPLVDQFAEGVFVWYDEAGLPGGAETTLEAAKGAIGRYSLSLEIAPLPVNGVECQLPELGFGIDRLDASNVWIKAYRDLTGCSLAEARAEGRRRRKIEIEGGDK